MIGVTALDWPETEVGGPLGDGRAAHLTERPSTLDELGEVVARRSAEGFAIYPQGGTTALDYGGIPGRAGVAVDLRGLDRLIDYPVADMTITVEAGMTLETLRGVLRDQGQRIALEAPLAHRATLGGIYATNASGPRRFGLGRPRDHIIGVRFVDAQGRTIKGGGRVVKNVAGYDFPRLLTGSMGTLGLIVELTLKVRPMPEASILALVRFARLADAVRAVVKLNTSGTRPVALELLNAGGARLAGPGDDLGLDEWRLVVGFEDNAASVAWQLDRLASELGRSDLEILRDDDSAPTWNSLVESQVAEVGPLTVAINLKPSMALGFLPRLDPTRWAIQSHAGNGIIRAHRLGDSTLEEVAPEVDRLLDEVATLGGSLILPRCPTAWKGRLRVWGRARPDWPMAEKVKAALDPGWVLNPGRFVGKI